MNADRSERRGAFLIALLLFAFALQAGVAAVRDSVTVDELAHLPVGLYFLNRGDFSPDPINPPLSRMLPALATVGMSPRLDPPSGADEWQMGLRFMRDNVDRYQEIYVCARVAVIGLGLLLGLLVYSWSLQIYGRSAALVALAFFAFSPMLLAHSHLVTVDAAGALGFVAGVHQVWTYRQRPDLHRAAVLGVVVALGLLLKLSCLPLVPFAAVALIVNSKAAPGGVSCRLGRAAVAVVAALLVVNLGYGFQGSGRPLRQIGFVRGGIPAMLAEALPQARVPLPEAFLRGVDLIASAELKGDRSFYLAGEVSTRGWWYYHLIAYALKTPLPLLLAIAIALFRLIRGVKVSGESTLWAGASLAFLTGGVLNPLNLGARHVLAAEPFLIILAAGALTSRASNAPASVAWRPPRSSPLAASLLIWHVVSSLAQAPSYLSYFNVIAGGPARGHEWLADSNVDWGQDLIRLREFMDSRAIDSVQLGYFGTVHPGAYGISFAPLSASSPEGIKVVSATLLVGLPFRIWRTPQSWERVPDGEIEALRRRAPSGRIGSLFFYEQPQRRGTESS